MRSAEYQTTVPLNFLITVHNYKLDNQPIKITTQFSGTKTTDECITQTIIFLK